MIVVDTSVWIDHFRDRQDAPHVRALRRAVFSDEPIIVGDLILLEVLLGAADEARAKRLEAGLRAFAIEPMLDDRLAVLAAHNFRQLRASGVTVRRSIDMVIGTFCIDRGYCLLHNDRNFGPMHQHLGLRQAELPE